MADDILTTLMIPVMDVASDRMVHSDGKERLNYWNAFKRLYDVFPYKNMKYGRIYNRFMIGNVLFALTRAQLTAEGKQVEPVDDEFPNSALSDWSEEDWDGFESYLKALVESMLRKDADAAPVDPEDSQIREDRAILFESKVEKVSRYVKIYKILLPIRAPLMQQLESSQIRDDSYPELDKKLVATLWKRTLEEKDERVRDQLIRKLFQEKEMTSRLKKNDSSELRTIGELRVNFCQKPFTFENFGNRLDVLMSDFCLLVFEDPRLNSFYFPDEVMDEESEEVLKKLREARAALGREGEDPLSDSIRLASSLVPETNRVSRRRSRSRVSRSGGLYKRKASATTLTFDESQEIDSDNPNGDGTHHLSTLPSRGSVDTDSNDEEYSPNKKSRKSQVKGYKGRRPWTIEEKNAIIEGIRKLGHGKWAQIKDRYALLFEVRTSGQIKDCYRTMVKKDEVPQDVLPPSE